MLTAATGDQVAELIAAGLVEPGEVVAGDVVIRERAGRRGGLAIQRGHGDAWFLKRDAPSPAGGALRHEARVLRELERHPSLAGLAPAVRSFDPRQGELVTRLIPGVSLRDAASPDAGVPADAAAELGSALGRLHQTQGGAHAIAPESSAPPWALSLHRPRARDLASLSPASLELVRLLQRQGGTCARVDALRAGWRAQTLIHGDLRWDNVIRRGVGAGPPGGICLVDWESAGIGDPAWDVGSVLGQLIGDWVQSETRRAGGPEDRLPRDQGGEMARVHATAAAFWGAYVEGGTDEAPAELLGRAVRYGGVRLLQLAVEIAQSSTAPGWASLSHLQVGANVLDGPELAAAALLGFVTDGR